MSLKLPPYINAERLRNYIPAEHCLDGHLYQIAARNASLGIYDSREKYFFIRRYKFGKFYLFEENHWDLGPDNFGTAKPMREIERVPRSMRNDPLGYLERKTKELIG